MRESGVFARLIEEHGSLEKEKEKEKEKDAQGGEADTPTHGRAGAQEQEQAALMQEEERYTGAVSWGTYVRYLRLAGGVAWAPGILGLLALTQLATGAVCLRAAGVVC